MDPQQVIDDVEISENRGATKSSHTTNPTTCSDIRRNYDACGICGSYNVVYQGVKYCKTCGIEVESLSTDFRWLNDPSSDICKCDFIDNGYGYKISPRKEYYIGKCLDCGAVEAEGFCPNCRLGKAWKHWDGRIKCRICGFTIDNPISCSIGAVSAGRKAQGKQGTRKAKQAATVHMSKRKQKRLAAKNRLHPNKVK